MIMKLDYVFARLILLFVLRDVELDTSFSIFY